MKRLKWLVVAGVVALLAAQLVPVDFTNPPVEMEVPAPPDALAVVRRACYECHSHETKWPWYSRIAPGSWLIAYDVSEGREHLNLSAWNRLSEKKQREAVEEIWEQVDKGDMPPWFYLPLHPEARLSAEDRDALRAWAASVGGAEG